jgi:hypothetical protein
LPRPLCSPAIPSAPLVTTRVSLCVKSLSLCVRLLSLCVKSSSLCVRSPTFEWPTHLLLRRRHSGIPTKPYLPPGVRVFVYLRDSLRSLRIRYCEAQRCTSISTAFSAANIRTFQSKGVKKTI